MDLWDNFLGNFLIYIENYELKLNNGGGLGIEPSYTVDYVIEDFETIQELMSDGAWYTEVIPSQNINFLPVAFKKAAIKFLPRYFKRYPQHQGAECLKVNNK